MELGEKLLRARQEAGLSQRQLCGDEITRNMLSRIEHGAAKPSMGTLQYLAGRLGKSVSYFLEEDAVLSPNQEIMGEIRRYFDAGNYALALDAMKQYRGPDAIFDRERRILEALCRLELAEKALGEGREPYARELLEETQTEGCYCAQALEKRKLLLLGRLRGADLAQICGKLSKLDEELRLRAEAAMAAGDLEKAGRLLDAAEDRTERWCFLRGGICLKQQDWTGAAQWYHRAENAYPKGTARGLEICYRELGDFKQAYYYACKQRE